MHAAIGLAKRLGLPRTFRNLYVIEAAIQAEKEFRGCSIAEAAEEIHAGAMAAAERGDAVNYFFFEDCRWRYLPLTWAEKENLARRKIRASWG